MNDWTLEGAVARDADVPWTAALRPLQVADEYVWTALDDRHVLLALLRDTRDVAESLIGECYFPHHTPSSESGPEEWDVQIEAPTSETCELVIRVLATLDALDALSPPLSALPSPADKTGAL